jgi:periplasmic copper chaperone A
MLMKIKNLFCFIVTTTIAFFSAYAYADDLTKGIFVNDAWVEAMPPSQSSSAAYMIIANNTPKAIVLLSASSDIAAVTELHQMSHMNGMMHMAMVSHLRIPSKGKVALQPGDFHIMLIDLKKPVNKGDIVPITLHFQDGGNITVKADVREQ